MAAWTDLTFAYKQLAIYQELVNLDVNFDALAEGAGGAPKFKTASFDADVITVDKLAHNINAVPIGFDADKIDGSHLIGINGLTSYGTYTGNDTVNRAIPHGLVRIPAIVLIYCLFVVADKIFYRIHRVGHGLLSGISYQIGKL